MEVKSLTVLIPAYNEEPALKDSVKKVIQTLNGLKLPSEIIVVNDGSSDGTGTILDSLAAEYPVVKAVHHAENKMIGGAFLSALSRSGHSHLILVPVDNPIEKDQLEKFLQTAKGADIVVGVRAERAGYKSWMKILSGLYWVFCVALFQVKLRDFTWISLYDKEKIRGLSIRSKGIAIFPEILVKAKKRGLKLLEIECPMTARRTGKATVSKITRIVHLFLETIKLWYHIHFQKW